MTDQVYEPRGGARELLLCRDPSVAVVGPAGTGKSLAMMYKAHLSSLMVPGLASLIVRQTHASLTSSTLTSFEREVAPTALANGSVRWFGGSGSRPPCYMYENGSRIYVGGMDRPSKFLSMNLGRIYVDEATELSLAAMEVLQTRLRQEAGTYRQLLACCNPGHPDHHIRRGIERGDYTQILSLHRDNPFLYHSDGTPTPVGADYLSRLESLSGVRRLRFLEGIWAAAEGLVYDTWSEADNVISFGDVPSTSRVIWSVDFGYSNAFVWQEWLVDGDGRMYLTREISRKQRLVEDHARDILELAGEYRPEAIVCDHDAEDRATLERHLGMPTVAARKGVSRGVQLMQARIRKAPDGRPRLFAVRGALQGRDDVAASQGIPRGFAAEILGYVWQTERGTDGIPREVPVKSNDHSCDAARYACAYLDWDAPVAVGNPASARMEPSGGRWSSRVG